MQSYPNHEKSIFQTSSISNTPLLRALNFFRKQTKHFNDLQDRGGRHLVAKSCRTCKKSCIPMFSSNVMFHLNVFKCVFNAYHIEFVHSTYVNAFYYFIPFIHDGSGSQFLASHTTFLTIIMGPNSI